MSTFITARDGHRYFGPDAGFLGLTAEELPDPASARVVVLPFGLEATVTYGRGTAAGPQAIIAASHELELFDDWFGKEPLGGYGVATRAPAEIPADLGDALGLLASQVDGVLESGRLPVVFGGEHSIVAGAIRPAVARWPDLTLLHFDAHADLRDGYRGERFSHAAAMRRCLDFPDVSVCSFGIRSISAEEIQYAESHPHRVGIAWARQKRRWNLDALTAPLAGKTVWISFDVDCFDPGLMPATGTPEPGGLLWDEVMDVLSAAAGVWSRVAGIDVNELAPIAGLHASDFVAARLAYRLTSFACASEADDTHG